MKKLMAVVLTITIAAGLAGCAAKQDSSSSVSSISASSSAAESAVEAAAITEQQALEAVKNYCYAHDPDLKKMETSDEYTIYWDVSTNDNNEIVVLYRSYTSAQIRYYVNPSSGDTYVTEFVPGITDEEKKTDERFNIRDYLK